MKIRIETIPAGATRIYVRYKPKAHWGKTKGKYLKPSIYSDIQGYIVGVDLWPKDFGIRKIIKIYFK